MPYAIFDGVFETFTEAGGDFGFFSEDFYIERQKAKFASGARSRLSYLAPDFIATAYLDREKLSVLDFGGGIGFGFRDAVTGLSSCAGLTYHIFDNPAVCALGRTLFTDPAPEFLEDLAALAPTYDIIHLGSVIQYVEDMDGFLRLLAGFKATFILVSDAMVGTERSFVTRASYFGHVHPHRFFRLDDLTSRFAEQGYGLVQNQPYLSTIQGQVGFYDMSNLPPECRVACTANLVFKKKT